MRGRLLSPPLVALLSASAGPARAAPPISVERLRYMTESSPPDNFAGDGGRPTGLFVDTLGLVWAELGIPPARIELLPWARAYRRAQDTPGAVLFSMARLPERQHLFKWVGPVRTGRFVLVAKRERAVRPATLDAAGLSRYRVGTVIDDAGEKLLAERGLDRKALDRAESFRSIMLKLVNDRVDAVVYGELPIRSYLRQNGLPLEAFEVVGVLSATPICFAFNRDTPDDVVARFRAALDAVRARPGVMDELFRKYEVPPEPREARLRAG